MFETAAKMLDEMGETAFAQAFTSLKHYSQVLQRLAKSALPTEQYRFSSFNKIALALREAVGETIGSNFDPSHLFWQGADPSKVIRALGDSIYHFHAKDTKIDPINTPVNGVLDNTSYADYAERSWIFRTVGYGHGEEIWRDMVSNLRLVGYDGALSIEHEDGLMSSREGFEKAVTFLSDIVIREEVGKPFWAD